MRTSVFAVREAPKIVSVDPLLFNHIIDNLLLNAAKHTEHGSIVVEISGTPGYLVLKISDTGIGISDSEVGALFRPLAREPGGLGFGAGLSAVVQLLGRIRGKLEVMTRAGSGGTGGTTFWAHFPVDAAAVTDEPSLSSTPEELVDKVVAIRRYSEG